MRSYDETKEARTRLLAYSEQPLHRRFRRIIDAIPPGSSVLDIACGTGTLIKALSENGCRVAGIDIAPGAVSLARAKGLDVMQGDIDAFEHTAEIRELLFAPYDVVIFSKSLQHLREKNAIMARLNVKRVFVHQRNRDHWRARLNRLLGNGENLLDKMLPYRDPGGAVLDIDSNAALRRWGESYGYSSRMLSGSFLRGKDALIEFTKNGSIETGAG